MAGEAAVQQQVTRADSCNATTLHRKCEMNSFLEIHKSDLVSSVYIGKAQKVGSREVKWN
jgi:hypothetical protein